MIEQPPRWIVFPCVPRAPRRYADPLDRRFHAQPSACFDCGPHITWRETASDMGRTRGFEARRRLSATREGQRCAIIERCAELLASGGIVAIKGLGGFHLACDAANEQAVTELRRRKRRSNKPLAVMVRNLAGAERLCHVNGAERDLLAGSIRPIVLLRRRDAGAGDSSDALALAPSVAHDLPELGVMLPLYPPASASVACHSGSPWHARACHDQRKPERRAHRDRRRSCLGNTSLPLASPTHCSATTARSSRAMTTPWCVWSMEPLCPYAVLADMRRNRCRCRRWRRRAPVLACGPQQKATIALTREDEDGKAACFVSQHIGDVENGATFAPGMRLTRDWKTFLTWRPPRWPVTCTPAIYRASGHASRCGSAICRLSKFNIITHTSRA